jgi:hypothetical protein
MKTEAKATEFEARVAKIKRANLKLSAERLQFAIDQALAAVRRDRRRAMSRPVAKRLS